MKTKWNEKSVVDKILLVLRIVISVVVLVGVTLQLTGVWDRALNIAVPLLSALILIQSIQDQKPMKCILLLSKDVGRRLTWQLHIC